MTIGEIDWSLFVNKIKFVSRERNSRNFLSAREVSVESSLLNFEFPFINFVLFAQKICLSVFLLVCWILRKKTDLFHPKNPLPKHLPVHKMIPATASTTQATGFTTPRIFELHQLRQIRHSTQQNSGNISGFIPSKDPLIVVINTFCLVNHSELPLSIYSRFLSRNAVKAKRSRIQEISSKV